MAVAAVNMAVAGSRVAAVSTAVAAVSVAVAGSRVAAVNMAVAGSRVAAVSVAVAGSRVAAVNVAVAGSRVAAVNVNQYSSKSRRAIPHNTSHPQLTTSHPSSPHPYITHTPYVTSSPPAHHVTPFITSNATSTGCRSCTCCTKDMSDRYTHGTDAFISMLYCLGSLSVYT